MRKTRGDGLVLAVVCGLALGAPVAQFGGNARFMTLALPLLVQEAAAQELIAITAEGCGIVLDLAGARVCTTVESESGTNGDATSIDGDGGNGGHGGNDGFETVHDVGNVREDASCSLIIGDITTGDEGNHTVAVDAGSVSDSVSPVPSVTDTGVDIVVPDCAALAETTVGSGITIDAFGNDGDDGRDATSTGNNGDDSNS